jgi:hypothetical protein
MNENKPRNYKSNIKHTIRTKNGNLKEVTLIRSLAIKAFCTECLGFGEDDPKNCTSIYCPLYPFRGKTLLAYDD